MSRRASRRDAQRAVGRLRGASAEAMNVLGSLRLEDGRCWAEAAEPWQLADAAAVLNDRAPHSHYLTRPRGASKTTDLAAVLVAWLTAMAAPDERGYLFAVDREQASLLTDAVAGLVARTEGLGGALATDAYKVTVASGARVAVMAADDASAWGLRGSFYVCEEFAQWPAGAGPRRLWAAILSAVPKVDGCRLVVLTTPGDPTGLAARVLDHARSSRAWRVGETPGPCPWVKPAALAEQKAMLTDAQYRRLHLGEWCASEDRLVDAERLRAAVVLDGPQDPAPGVTYRVGADIGLRHDRTAIAVCHAEPAPGRPDARRVVLDRMVVFRGSRDREVQLADVETALVEISRAFGHPTIRLDPWQGIGLAQRLRAQGLTVEEFSFTAARYAQAAQTLFTLLRDGLLSLYDDEALLDELATVKLRETSPGLLRVDTDDRHHHDDQVVALGFATVPLVERPESNSAIGSGFVGRVDDDTVAAGARVGAPTGTGGFGGPIEIPRSNRREHHAR